MFLRLKMPRCTECWTEINIENLKQERVECHGCGIDLELTDKGSLIPLQLGPSEE